MILSYLLNLFLLVFKFKVFLLLISRGLFKLNLWRLFSFCLVKLLFILRLVWGNVWMRLRCFIFYLCSGCRGIWPFGRLLFTGKCSLSSKMGRPSWNALSCLVWLFAACFLCIFSGSSTDLPTWMGYSLSYKSI